MMYCREICKFAEMVAMTKREVLLSVMRLVDNINMKRIKRLLEIAMGDSIFVFQELNYT